jgi:hypothetical protein
MFAPAPASRVRGPILFIGIVWSIAFTFLLLEHGTYRLIDWGYRSATISDQYGMPTPSPQASAQCESVVDAQANSTTQHQPDPSISRKARLIAWKVGSGFGVAVGLERAGAIDAAQRQESIHAIQPLSQALGVPTPVPPPAGPTTGALPEYGQLVEDDTSCTVALLSHLYGTRVGHIYKLGALTSFAAVYRTVCPQCGALFVSQIRHHGKEAGLSDEASQPFTQIPPSDESAEIRRQKAMAAVQTIEELIKAEP